MPESITHINLVSALVTWISQKYFDGCKGFILVDSPESCNDSKPPKINGSLPDVYAEKPAGNAIIIGEAKTAGDLENRHTREQIKSFLIACAIRKNSVLILAVPWHHTRYARTLLKSVGISCGCQSVLTIVLDQLEG